MTSRFSDAQMGESSLNNVPNHPIIEKDGNNLKINIIARDDIPSIHQVEVEGKVHNLGILKDLRKQSFLAAFIPEDGRLSMSWVSLKSGEILTPHQHPTASMIIICEGEGEIIGDCNQPLKTGDIAAIPPHNIHGFIGRGKNGLWGLSIQFEGLGLYENRTAPRVTFLDQDTPHTNFIKSEILIKREGEIRNSFDVLLKDQHQYETAYKKSLLMELLKTSCVQDPAVQERLLEALNYWGNWFQRIIFARAAIEGEPQFQDIAEDHICEEAGHNKNILAARGHKPIKLWDPILEACAAWFYEKMLSGTDAERTILIHFVLEGSGQIFHLEASQLFPNIDHFRLHGEEDGGHFDMGCQLLKETPGLDFDALKQTLQRGWAVMEILCNRIAILAEQKI